MLTQAATRFLFSLKSQLGFHSSTPTPTLIHFTNRKALTGILTDGFALLPCDRKLLDDLWGTDRPFIGDPQNFGMICFTDSPLHRTKKIRAKGDYGIAVKWHWALKNDVRKVIYISTTEAIKARSLVKAVCQELDNRIRFKDDEGLKLAYKNKQFAHFMGAPTYAQVLDVYEFSQTSEDRYQREWRITQHLPLYNQQAGALPNPANWGRQIYYRQIDPPDIAFLVCPKGKEDLLRTVIPAGFRNLEIRTIKPIRIEKE